MFANRKTLLVVAVSFFALGCGSGTAEQPKGAPDTSKWTHKELTEHLKAKGLKFETKREVGMNSQPAMSLVFAENSEVLMELFPTAQAAKEFAATSSKEMFSFGRFVGYSKDAKALSKVQDALK